MMSIQPKLDELTSKKLDVCHIKNSKLVYTLLFQSVCKHLAGTVTISFLIFGLDTITE